MRLLPLLFAVLPGAVGCDALSQRGPATGFSGDAALRYTQEQVNFGPRVPGTPAHVKAGDWITARMRERADTVIEQRFMHVTQKGDVLPMRNILARFNRAATQRILYVTHWDTRPVADSDPVLGKRTSSFDGANDGAAGVGLFVALADEMKKLPPGVGVDLLFVDGEDWGSFDGYDEGRAKDVLVGSTYFARHLPEPGYQPLFGVVWDMIGDARLNIPQEGYSLEAAPEVVQRVWKVAADLGYSSSFLAEQGDAIVDDHLPLIRIAKFRMIDVLDIDYRGPNAENYHHTTMDTMDKLSAKSLQTVGDVALTVIRGM